MYRQEITRKHRTAFVIAVDCSQSMAGEICSADECIHTKSAATAEIINRVISEIIMRARREEGLRDYYDICVLGYSGRGVEPLIDSRRMFIPVTEMENYCPARRERLVSVALPDGSVRVRTQRTDLWIQPRAEGLTPMYDAFCCIRDIVSEWCSRPQNADSFPPVVINITDGEVSDCTAAELADAASQIKSLGTSDGNVLLLNIHITSGAEYGSLVFPTAEEIPHDNRTARLLAECSSVMPQQFDALIRSHRGDSQQPPFLAMGYNASMTELLAMLSIGSRSVTPLR